MKKEDKQPLTKALHQQLVNKGYRYFSIEDVGYSKDGATMTTCTVKVIKDLPHSFHKSCTGIDDGMITSLIDGHASKIGIFIVVDWE